MNCYKIGEETFEVELKESGAGRSVFVNGREAARGVVFERLPGKGLLVKIGGSVLPAFVHREGSEFFCWAAGETYRISAFDPAEAAGMRARQDAEGWKKLIAPMPGKVVKAPVKAGDEVKRGAKIIVIESMKMETEIAAPCDGRIKTLKYAEGDVFTEGEVLVEIE